MRRLTLHLLLLLLLHLRMRSQTMWLTLRRVTLTLLHAMLMHMMMMRMNMRLLLLLLRRGTHRIPSYRTIRAQYDWCMCSDDWSRWSCRDAHLRLHPASLALDLLRLWLRWMWLTLEWSSIARHLLLHRSPILRSHRRNRLRTTIMSLTHPLLRHYSLHMLRRLSLKIPQIPNMRTQMRRQPLSRLNLHRHPPLPLLTHPQPLRLPLLNKSLCPLLLRMRFLHGLRSLTSMRRAFRMW